MQRIATTLAVALLLGLLAGTARADDRPGVSLEGSIEAIGEADLTLHGVTFRVTALTRIYNTMEQPIPFGQLTVGQRVEVEGYLGSDGFYYAHKIELEHAEDRPDRVEARGRIHALSEDSLVVQGFTFWLTAQTEIEGELALDRYVEIEGEVQNEQFIALRIEAGMPGAEGGEDLPEIEIAGPILQLQDSVLVVRDFRIRVTAHTRIQGEEDQPLTLADLQVGLLVEVKARIDQNGQLLATKIEVKNETHVEVHRRKVEIKGFIRALTDSTLTVGGLTFRVTNLTRIHGEDDQPLSFADLQVGQFVEVKGYFDPRHQLLFALKIEVEDVDEHEFELVGRIEAIGGDSLVVGGLTFQVNNNTVIEDAWDRPLTLADLQVGMLVKVKALIQPDGTLLATRIKVRKAFHPVVDVRGPIEALTDSTLTVAGLVFHARPGIYVIDAQGQQATLSDLQVGMVVRVRGVVHPDGTYWAMRIRVLTGEDAQEVEFKGTIEALGADSLIVAGLTIFVDAGTQILAHDGTPITLADLQTGQIVEVKATIQPGLGLVALEIKLEDFVAATGQADSVRADAVVVQQMTFLIDAQTVVVDEHQRPIAWSDVQAGQQVIVYGRRPAPAGKTGATTAGTTYTADYVTVLGTPSTTSAEPSALPATFELAPSYPNPFRQQTTIRFTLGGTAPQPVTLEVYNVLGQRVRTLVQGMLSPGRHEVIWDATDDAGRPAASGLYLYRLRVGNQVQTRSMVLMR
ncbi:DUF5666 domain-containing protein [Rhodothermus marinus]|uniref:DUF5666 domain-containing protein n=1 Tax=Rhodothermus marinus TaxID=29549 RepID=UPI001DB16594|nr:DUF5666 domain-containing protein [Rhodothermus marinus]MBO2490963.1 T9SS type A sorting domain-containing protein [Rhodothermus marinus]